LNPFSDRLRKRLYRLDSDGKTGPTLPTRSAQIDQNDHLRDMGGTQFDVSTRPRNWRASGWTVKRGSPV
jgi:hypothetical protein